MSLSVIIPTFNEKENIGLLITEILRACSCCLEIIVVDDDSPDRTWQTVEEIAKKESRVRLIRRVNKRGLASAIKEGIDSAKTDVVLWMDSDLSMPPDKIPLMIEKLSENDIVLASRYAKGGADARKDPVRVLSSRLLNAFAGLILSVKVRDLTSGFCAARKSIFKDISFTGIYGEYFISFIYKAIRKNYRICEIPYTFSTRRRGQTKTSPGLGRFFSLGMVYLAMIFRLRFRKG